MNARRLFAVVSGQALFDVGAVTDLAHLAIVDDIDSRSDLFLHDGVDGRLQPLVKCRLIVRFALIPRDEQFEQVIGARKTAGVSCQYAVAANLHGGVLSIR